MKQLILVDACNLFHRLPDYRARLHEGIDLLAGRLLEQLQPLHDLEQWEVHVVVDGKGAQLDQVFPTPARTLSIVFAPLHQTADTVIEAWLIHLGPGWQTRVATGDRAILHTAHAHGAETLSPAELLDWAARVRERHARQHANRSRQLDHEFGNRLEGLP